MLKDSENNLEAVFGDFYAKPLIIKTAAEPSDIIWENRHVTDF